MSKANSLLLTLLCFFAFLGLAPSLVCGNNKFPEMMFILDGSGSMWGKAGDEVKISIARKVMTEIVPSLPPEVRLGLTAYGHNRKGDCNDIEVLLPPGSTDRQLLLDKVMGIKPKGKTPIEGSLRMVTGLIKEKEVETIIVLVSDGEETCDQDPCGAVQAMKQAGIRFILHVVGFDVSEEQEKQLSCLAKAGGGEYFTASDSAALLSALQQVEKTIVQKVEKAKTTTKKATTALGKLQIVIPEPGLVSLNTLKLQRESDGKVIKTIKDPQADSLHPLLKGEYLLIGGFANSNYKPDSEVPFGTWEVKGGEVTRAPLGLMEINISKTLEKMPVGAVVIRRTDDADFALTIPTNNNPYYLYKPKPLPPGTYSLAVHYRYGYLYTTPETEIVLADQVKIEAGSQAVVTLDSGIRLAKPASNGAAGFILRSIESTWEPLEVLPAKNGDYPLWETYCVPAGNYALEIMLEGAEEPLPVADNLVIGEGELVEFDTGL